jgi:hypothetical protein
MSNEVPGREVKGLGFGLHDDEREEGRGKMQVVQPRQPSTFKKKDSNAPTPTSLPVFHVEVD